MTITSNDQAATTIAPVLQKYDELFTENKIDELVKIYGADAVLITKGKEAAYGRDAIGKVLAKFSSLGKTETKVENKKIEGFGDHVIFRGDYSTTVLESGHTIKGSFQQIFRLENGEWLICFDEFTMA